MSEVSIKVNIAGRTYPLTIKALEEPGIRNAEQAIEESIQVFQKNYAVKDKQDLLAMAALQMAAKAAAKQEPKIERVVERVVETVEVPADFSNEFLALEARLDEYLS
ncbi:MAG: cell division protein ZapA [Flavobacteriales bacterium]|nr:cell division protein ZapA [Flavobacteriales bacterium]